MDIRTDYQTPKKIASYMADMVPNNCFTILEPTPGIGNIVEQLEKRGYNVIAPEDYFLLKKEKYDCIVMNPPFSSKSAILDYAPEDIKTGMKLGYWFLLEAMKLSNHVIALMPWFTLSDSDVRLRQIKRFGLKSITALPRKTFEYVRIQTVILQLEKGYSGETKFIVYDCLQDKDQTNLF